MEQLWGVAPAKISSTADVALGYQNCFGDTYEWKTAGINADVYALLPDGTEQKVNTAQLAIPRP
jgi:hypothetical protein